jgi:hypothetical protein
MLFAIGAWAASFAVPHPAWVVYRRRAQGSIGVIVPFLAAFLVAPYFGLHAEPKYLYHAKAACAVAAGLPIGLIASALLRAVSMRLLLVVERALPFALALLMLVPRAGTLTASDERTPTVNDLAAVSGILGDQHGWGVLRMLQSLKTPSGVAVLGGLPLMPPASGTAPIAADTTSTAVLLVLEADDVPDPLPSGWSVIRRTAQAATVLVVMRSRIEWGEFEVCVQATGDSNEHCAKSGWRREGARILVPGMPPPGQAWRGTVSMSLPFRGAAFADTTFMPRMRFVCGGNIVSPSGGAVRVEPDQRHATIGAAEGGEATPTTIKLEWYVGSPECDVLTYDALVPFFVEGDAETVGLIEAILRKREG